MPVTGSVVRASRKVRGPVGTGWTHRDAVADADVQGVRGRAGDDAARPAGRQRCRDWKVGCQSGRRSPTVSSATSTRRAPGAMSVDGRRSEVWLAPTARAAGEAPHVAAVRGRCGATRSTVRRRGAPASASLRLASSVRSKESMTPASAMTIVTTAPMPEQRHDRAPRRAQDVAQRQVGERAAGNAACP